MLAVGRCAACGKRLLPSQPEKAEASLEVGRVAYVCAFALIRCAGFGWVGRLGGGSAGLLRMSCMAAAGSTAGDKHE